MYVSVGFLVFILILFISAVLIVYQLSSSKPDLNRDVEVRNLKKKISALETHVKTLRTKHSEVVTDLANIKHGDLVRVGFDLRRVVVVGNTWVLDVYPFRKHVGVTTPSNYHSYFGDKTVSRDDLIKYMRQKGYLEIKDNE